MATATQPVANGQVETQTTKRDFRQEVTDSIVQMLEQGVAPWQKPWEPAAGAFEIPVNPTTEKSYRGGNAIHLMATALRKGYDDPRWMTYRQAAENGWQVRKGEKGSQIEFWEIRDRSADSHTSDPSEDRSQSPKSKSLQERRLIHRVYTVFNAKQIDGIPERKTENHSTFEAVHAGEQILQNSAASIAHDQADRAFYNRRNDSIHLPPRESFKSAPAYYGTALHELAHWSGHPSRLNRQTLTDSYRFGDINYAKEELRAELASVFLAAERGIPHDPQQHAAYVGSWIKSLKEDKNEIFRAAHDASAAADFLLSLERDRSVAEQSLDSTQGRDIDTGDVNTVTELNQEAVRLQRDRERLEESPALDEISVEGSPSKSGKTSLGAQTKRLENERALAASSLGNDAKTYPAQVESGIYRGQIIGETAAYVVQRVSSRSAVAHPKEALDRQISAGEHVLIKYSNGNGLVRESHQRSRDRELAR
ncbi:MAG TPA: zincin-like metallopeptidase domain-containing protein [Bryobacteraceae bacterium]|nr:zincin-like metallopeptidase domain-containing protein [Bryobacteraceae bacterium]